MNIHISRQTVIGFVVALTGLGLVASSAEAAPRPRDLVCKGVVKETTVRNVTVPEGTTCTMSNAAVTGRVTVAQSATFSMSHVRIDGGLRLGLATRFIAVGGVVRGGVVGSPFNGTSMNGTVITGQVRLGGQLAEMTLSGVTVNGPLSMAGGGVSVSATKVNGSLTLRGVMTRVSQVSVVGDLRVDGIKDVSVCGTVANSDVTVSGNWLLGFGNGSNCRGNRVVGDTSLTAQGVSVYGNVFEGDAGANSPVYAIKGSGNRFGGEVTGDMAQLQN